jgi:hypothetical protein
MSEAVISDDKIDYTVDDCTRDCELLCKDDITLYYTSYLLAKHFVVLKQSFTQKNDKKLIFQDFDSNVVMKVLEWIDKENHDDDDKIEITMAEGMYKFANRYNYKNLTNAMETLLVKNPRLSSLEILYNYKSPNYKNAIINLLDSKVHIEQNIELEYVHRYIFNDVIHMHQQRHIYVNNNLSIIKNLSDEILRALSKEGQYIACSKIKDYINTIINYTKY